MSPLPVEQNAADVRWFNLAKVTSEPGSISCVGSGAVVGNDLGVCDRILAELIYIYILSLMSKFY
ncbi:MAG TPA: hypothetical protein DEV81_05965 [Cyanobacteria bacterium UBA11049]|nr:hypothetical protein [Cyanobacteria bacterium UBA11049]